jgi:hypothetical protein
MGRVNSYKANYRESSVDTGNHIKDKYNIKTRDKLQASNRERKHVNTEKVNKNKDEEKYTKDLLPKNYTIQKH